MYEKSNVHIFPGYEKIWIVRSTISRIGLNMDRTIHYFKDRTEYGSYDILYISRIGRNMDRTIHYFQDRTDYGSCDPLFPG